jgi:16S rRNA (guanine527-N7)-methyltransferase
MMISPPSHWKLWEPALEGLVLPDDFFIRMDAYLEGLANINQSVNLVSFKEPDELRGHAVDSLQALRASWGDRANRIIDVGAGGGFPGVPLAIARPDWAVHLLDSTRKKQEAVQSLLSKIPNARAIWGRAEDVGRPGVCRESYDAALCRAVGWLGTVLELTLPLVRVGGQCLLHRGSEAGNELREVGKALEHLGGRVGDIIPYRLPGLDKERFMVCIEKSSQTGDAYPRRVGIPAKRPLK